MTVEPVLRIGMLGYGYWGPHLVRNFAGVPEARVTVVADLDPARLAAGPSNGWVSTTDWQAVLEGPETDAVVIATPAATHHLLVKRALQAGKHVLVEKPLALSAAEGRELAALAERQHRVLMVGHTFLYNAAVRRLREYVSAGELGRVLYVSAQRLSLGRVRNDVNALWNFGPHDVSIILYLLGRRPIEVSARGITCLQPGVEDVVFLTLLFPDRVAAHVHLSWLDPQKVRRMTVVGTRKMAVYDDVSVDAKITLFDRGVDLVPTADSPRDFKDFAEFQLRQSSGDIVIPPLEFPEPLAVECAHFIECIRRDVRPLTDGTHGVEVVEILEAAQRSLRCGGVPERLG